MRLLVFAVFGIYFIVTAAYANGPASGATFAQPATQSPPHAGSGQLNPLKDPSYKQCGQDCLYGKANENIYFQSQFIQKKMNYIEQDYLFDEGEKPGEGLRKRKELLGNFCWKKPWAKDDEPDEDCAKRYLKTQQLWLARARGGMSANNKSRYTLSCDETHTCKTVLTLQPENGEEKKKDQLLSIPRSQDLSLSQVVDTPQTFSIQSLEPQKDDFVKYTLVNLNSSDPMSKKSFEIPQVVGGHIQYDHEAYEKAHKRWVELNQVGSTTLPLPAVEASHARFQADFQGLKAQDQKSVDRVLYDDIRGEIIKYVNDLDWGSMDTAAEAAQVTPSTGPKKSKAPSPVHYKGDEEVVPVSQTGKSHNLIVNPSAIETDLDSVLPPNNPSQ